jgi:hypothetical protein
VLFDLDGVLTDTASFVLTFHLFLPGDPPLIGEHPESMKKDGVGGVRKIGFWTRQIDKIGVSGSLFGSFFAGLCCLGSAALMSILSAFGLPF